MFRLRTGLVTIAIITASCGGAAPATTTAVSAPTTQQPPSQTSAVPETTALSTTTTTAQPAATSTTQAPTTTMSSVASTAEPLVSYRFAISVAVVPNPGDPPGAPVYELAGEQTTAPMAARIFGDFKGEDLELVTDGARWWDLDDLDLEIGAADIEFFLGGNGFLLPEWMEQLLIDDPAWQIVGSEVRNGVETSRSRRINIIGGVDWDLGDLAQLDVWRDDLGQLVKLQAWFAVGDNTGFPVSIWEITERNPQLTIQLPAG